MTTGTVNGRPVLFLAAVVSLCFYRSIRITCDRDKLLAIHAQYLPELTYTIHTIC